MKSHIHVSDTHEREHKTLKIIIRDIIKENFSEER